jgi:Chaperone of endosialidase
VGRARLVIENGLGHQWFANTWSRIDQFSIGRVGKRDDLVIDANGNVGISGDLNVAGSATKPGGGSWGVGSDIRLKKNVEPLKGALGKLLRLRGILFEWKEPEKQGNLVGSQLGLVAQEVEEVFPEWVDTDPSGYKILTVRGFEALAIEAFRELKTKNETLKLKNEELEDRIKILESTIPERQPSGNRNGAVR